RHGSTGGELRGDVELEVEAYRIDKVARARDFQKHQPVELDATARKETRRVAAGTILVRTGQPLGSLAACLLEPQSADGLATWNFFDSAIEEGKDFPVMRLLAPVALTTGSAAPSTHEGGLGPQPPGRFGSGIGVMTWLEDGKH